jgi:phosphoglycolate phosphatase-like HAD superfamily hydrolase
MDGTLLRTDVTWDGVVDALWRSPRTLAGAAPTLLRGRAAFKQRLATLGALDVAGLPWRTDLLDYLHAARARGRALHLATGADETIARAVATHLGLFGRVWGSDGATNLTGPRKAAVLVAAFPEGFVYAGDSAADLHVWRRASGAILVGVSGSVERAVARLGTPVEARFGR